MTTLEILSGLVAAVVAASVCNKLWLKIPLPFCQIIMGVLLWALPFTTNFVFNPEVFMICMIAPLLFCEGQNVSRQELWNLRVPIFLLAMGLVIVTVIAGGFLIHYLIPTMSLATSFALAAIISPTDLIAVQSMTKGLKLPGHLMSILEGESLLNDAAGIVSFKLALATVITGIFSKEQAFIQFLVSSLGGIAIGLMIAFLIIQFRLFLRKHSLEEIPLAVVIQIVTPLMIYYIAEEMDVSGILAVVAAGILHGVEKDRLRKTTTKLRAISDNVWHVAEYLLNGLVFVLLGYLLPQVFIRVEQVTPGHRERFLLVVIGVSVALFMVRFLWVFLWHKQFVNKKLSRIQKVTAFQLGRGNVATVEADDGGISRGRYALITALCGVHGTFTLATALSIPYALPDGSDFPFRDGIILISSGVVLISLLCAAICLPRFLEKEARAEGLSFKEANCCILKKAITHLEAEKKEAAYLVIHRLEKQLAELENENGRPRKKLVIELVRNANKAAVVAIEQYIDEEELSEEKKQVVAQFVARFNQMSERAAVVKAFWRIRFRKKLKRNKMTDLVGKKEGTAESIESIQHEFYELQKIASKASIAFLKKAMTEENRKEVLVAISYYSTPLNWMYVIVHKDETFRETLKNYHKQAYQIQRDAVEDLYETAAITEEMAKELRENLLYGEMQEVVH